ncbi:MAG TPA: hypothetical protein VHB79_21975 [Polyangiaceae bacterium]|nr:hypothetical protein [Polyangiaceae bacterium]
MLAKKTPKTRARAASSKTAKQARSKSGGKIASQKGPPVGKRRLTPLEVQLRKTLAEMGLARARRVFAAVEKSFDD